MSKILKLRTLFCIFVVDVFQRSLKSSSAIVMSDDEMRELEEFWSRSSREFSLAVFLKI